VRIVAITENITVDGSIEMLTDWFDPQRQGDADKSDLLEKEAAPAHAMIEAGLVDEYRLFVYPTVQGGGRRLSPMPTGSPA
jgi:hypothetical protein